MCSVPDCQQGAFNSSRAMEVPLASYTLGISGLGLYHILSKSTQVSQLSPHVQFNASHVTDFVFYL